MKRFMAIILVVILMSAMVGCTSPVETYVEQIEEMKIPSAIEGLGTDLENLLTDKDVLMLTQDEISDYTQKCKDIIEKAQKKKVEIEGIEIDDEEVKTANKHLLDALNQYIKGVESVKKIYEAAGNVSKNIDKSMDNFNKADKLVDKMLDELVSESYYNTMKKLKIQESILKMIKDTDEILDNKDQDKYDIAKCESILEKIEAQKTVLADLKVGKSDQKQHTDLLNFYDQAKTAFIDLKKSMETVNEMDKISEQFTKSLTEATESLDKWAKIFDEIE